MEPRAAKFGLIDFGCSTITRLARERGQTGRHMVGTKRYGVDGPPHLVGRSRRASPDELLGWFRQTQEPAGADWPDVERKQRLERLLSRLGEWLRIVVCYCGRDDHFRVLTTDPLKPLTSRDGIELGVVHLNLVCSSCNRDLAVFDNRRNGWNAVVCGDRSTLPFRLHGSRA